MKPDIKPRTLLIAAGGTGGHIFPGLAVAKEMHKRGWRVLWLGHPERMEGAIVPGQGFELLPLRFAGLRGKGCKAWLKLPFTLLAACLQARAAIKQCQPDVVLGMGGYVAFPAGLMAKLSGTPLVIHEQNAVAGSTNRWLARLAHTTLAGFPGALPGAQVAGNPVDERMFMMPDVATRYSASIDAPLRIVVMGGSQGAQVLNDIVPQALAMVREALNHPPAPPAAHADKGVRPMVRVHHQTGRGSDDDGRMEAVRAAYRGMPDVQHCCEAFFDTVCELAQADVLIARAGAMTVSEVAAAGVATLFVPLPHAIDDHQRANARFLSDCGSAWLQEQKDFTAQWLAQWLMQRTRSELMQTAQRARQHARPQAAQHIADTCERAADKTAPPLPSGGIGAAATKDTA